MWLICHFILRKLYTEHSIGASYQISIKIFFQLANHKQELPMAAMEILYRLSGKGEDF